MDLSIYYAHQFVQCETLTPRTDETLSRLVYENFSHSPICKGTTTGRIYLDDKRVATFSPNSTDEFTLNVEDGLEVRPERVEFNRLGRLVVLWSGVVQPNRTRVEVDYEYDMHN